MPDLTCQMVLYTVGDKRQEINIALTLARTGGSLTDYALSYPDVAAIANNNAIGREFYVEFITAENEVVWVGKFTFSTTLASTDLDFTTISIGIDNTQLVIAVTLPLRSVTGGAAGGGLTRVATRSLVNTAPDGLIRVTTTGNVYLKDGSSVTLFGTVDEN